MSDIAKAYVQIVPSAEGIKGKLESAISGEATGAGNTAGGLLGSGLLSTLSSVFSIAAVGKILKDALDQGAQLEQSIGGVETLFKNNADTVTRYAQEAYRTTGLSANEYMQSVTSFSASLLQSLGGDTAKAADIANMAMIDMADNSNKMGTSMEAIQNAYQGFAKQNYTMLDNLKLGYGGTKSEMERLLADAQKLTGVEYDINKLSDVYSAIHAIQENLDITGTTAKEAASTLSGSFNSVKASLQNVAGYLATGMDVTPALEGLLSSTVSFLTNLGGMLFNIVSGLAQSIVPFIVSMAPMVSEGINQLINDAFSFVTGGGFAQALQAGVDMITQFVNGVLQNLPSVISSAISMATQWLATLMSAAPQFLSAAGTLILNLVQGIISNLPATVSAIVSGAVGMISTLASYLPQFLTAGIQYTMQIAAGLIDAIPDLLSSVGQVAQDAWNTFKQTDWISLGSDIISGIVSGIAGAAGNLFNSLKNLASNALEAAKSALNINSPSKVFRDIVGRGISEGIAAGIDMYSDMPIMSVRRTVASVTNAGAEAVPSSYNNGVDMVSAVYQAVREGMEEANVVVAMNERELGRMVRDDLGVALG